MQRSTILICLGALVGQPLLWLDSPLSTLGLVIFSALACMMIALGGAGLTFWVVDRE
jgi:hypothetical protein